MKLIYYNTRFRGEWDFILDVRLLEFKNKAKLDLTQTMKVSKAAYGNVKVQRLYGIWNRVLWRQLK